MKNIRFKLFTFILFLSACKSVQKATELEEGFYTTSKAYSIDSLSISFKDKSRFYLEDYSDFILLYPVESNSKTPIKLTSDVTALQPLHLRQNTLDLDLFVVPLKIRPTQADVPTQLNTNFNASAYLGFRRDFLKVTSTREFRPGSKRNLIRNGIGGGLFAGISSAAINPTVTQGIVNQEYDGLTFSYGISTIYAVQKFNAGIAVGFDFLSDKNRKAWIYQNKPWFGVLVGLNLN